VIGILFETNLFMTEQKPSASILVRNIAPSTNPPTQKVLSDFFVFCGNIVALSILPEKDPKFEDSLTAVITFESEAAAKTAQLLTNALINDRPIVVEMAPVDFKPSLATGNVDNTQTIPPEKTEPSVISDILDTGYLIGSDVAARARALDEQTGVSQKLNTGIAVVSAAVTNLDTQYQITETARQWTDQFQTKVKGIDEQFEISSKASEVGQQVGGFFTAATTTAVTSAETAAVAVGNFVDTNPQVAMSIETVKAVGRSIGATIESGFNALLGTNTTVPTNPSNT